MAITVPNTINNITSSQIVTQSGQACVPANLLDANFQALANPVNPVIPVTGSISLSTANSGNIYELNAPSSNATITLPTPTNGFNAIFVCNNSSSYTYTFTTPSGSILWNNTTGASVTPNTTSGVYFLVSDGTNYLMGYELGAPIPSNSISVTGIDLTMSGTTGTAITNATLVASGVTAGIYGDLLDIPQLTVDSKGRITSAKTNPVIVNLTNASSDYNLSVGQTAYISFSNATSFPLHIATSSGTYYEMDVAMSNSTGTSGASANPVILNPNNTTYSNAFGYVEIYRNTGESSAGSTTSTYSAFRIGWAISSIRVYIINFTTNKHTKGFYFQTGTSLTPTIDINTCCWNDTTTAWTSLGTITFPQSSSGYILVRRLQ